MNTGDLVLFQSSYDKFMEEYGDRNPGIIIEVGSNSATVRVLWANGEITHEHASYITIANRHLGFVNSG